jgi:hypothetical protein
LRFHNIKGKFASGLSATCTTDVGLIIAVHNRREEEWPVSDGLINVLAIASWLASRMQVKLFCGKPQGINIHIAG